MQDYEINRLRIVSSSKDAADNPQKDEYPFLASEENGYRLALKTSGIYLFRFNRLIKKTPGKASIILVLLIKDIRMVHLIIVI